MSIEALAPTGNMGAPVPRLDGRTKMTGAAPYALGAVKESKLFSEGHYLGTSRLFATSLSTKAGAMPADDRLALDDHRAKHTRRQPAEPYKDQAIETAQESALGCPRRSAFNC